MDPRQLETFLAVAGELNFRRAAGKLNYAQSSVTAQVKALESELGVPLFDRVGRRVVLTDAGRRMAGYAERILGLTEEARSAVADGVEGAVELRVSATETHLTYRLPEVFGPFRERYPRAKLVLDPVPVGSFDADTVRALREGRVDVAFVLDEPAKARGIAVETLVEESVVLLAAPDHALVSGSAVEAGDLVDVPLLMTRPACGYRRVFERVLAEEGVYPNVALEFDGIESIKRCAAAGMGVALLPEVAAATELGRGELAVLAWSGPDLGVLAQATWSEERWISPTMHQFLETTREILATSSGSTAHFPTSEQSASATRTSQ